MSSNKLKLQAFRANDLSEDTGKQFELGRSWCDFFEIDENVGEITFHLYFKPLSKAHENLANQQIDLQLSALTARNDRKAYANGARSGHSAIKEFFLEDLHLTAVNNSNDYFAIYKASEFSYFLYYVPKLLHDNFIKFFESISPTVTINRANEEKSSQCNSLQQIYYGAPGTGKSHEINRLTEGKNVTRTTFHPDTDYSTFVGCYKPHMEEVDMTTVIGETLKVVKDEKGEVKKEKRIVYKYSCQAFLQAYIAAWQQPEKEHYLIIEEINRGNCAQIFGDIFQLLDRNWSGYSCYPIKADADMEQELKSLFAKEWNMGEELSMRIDNMYAKHYPEGIIKEIKDGSLLLLPQNLFIWATMNTSDQSLFPIDSAFKRRWDWKYVKIAKGRSKETKVEYNWRVKFDYLDDKTLFHCSFDWWDFINTINEEIAKTTSSDDKKLGYFFCKPKEQDGEFIDADTFVGKVVFYLWNDVYKDESSDLFKVAEGQEPSFDLFYKEKEEDGEWKVFVDTNCLKSFVDNVFKKQPDKVIVEAEHQETEEKQESSVE